MSPLSPSCGGSADGWRDESVDPVGACVGLRGSRVQAVVQELRGEAIDIICHSEDPTRYVRDAIAPATVSKFILDNHNRTIELIVPDDQLSKAIGRQGQNVRLAALLLLVVVADPILIQN